MNGICDIHSHILPGLDDGAQTLEETMTALRMAVDQGVHTIIATPHHHPGRYVAEADQVKRALHEVKRKCLRTGLDISILPGQECFYYSGLLQMLQEGRALTLAGSRYVLVEFEPDCMFQYLMHGLAELTQHGYRPILAHFERYQCLSSEEHLQAVRSHGAMLQMNFSTLLHKSGPFSRNPWKRLVLDGTVDFLASDCHGMHYRPLQADKAYAWLQKKADQDTLERLLWRNSSKLLNNE